MNDRLDLDVRVPAREIIRVCRSRGLVVQQRATGSQTAHPGSRHWHIRRPEGWHPGTLELTEADGRVWLTVKRRWDGGWARALARRLADPRP
jgi:hypothetical protein